jgi:methionyl-tRNA formyltransferase
MKIIIATPHGRYDGLEQKLRKDGRFQVKRVRARSEMTYENLAEFGPDLVVFPHWSWKIPDSIVEQYECIVFHMTDLPYGRGGSPLQNLIVRGVGSTQLSALRCGEEIDAGPIYLKSPLSTLGTAEEVLMRAAELMYPMIVRIATERIQPVEQAGEVKLFERRRPEQGDISNIGDIGKIFDVIRMLDGDGYPGAFINVGKLKLIFSRATMRPGKILADVLIELSDPCEDNIGGENENGPCGRGTS